MCIKSPLFKINKCSRTLYNLPNLSMGELSKGYEVDGGVTSRHGVS
jgi:hypothetical protein